MGKTGRCAASGNEKQTDAPTRAQKCWGQQLRLARHQVFDLVTQGVQVVEVQRLHHARLQHLLTAHIDALLADGGEDFTGHPRLELGNFRALRLRAHGEAVQARLANEAAHGVTPNTLENSEGTGVERAAIHAVTQPHQIVVHASRRHSVPEGDAHVGSQEPSRPFKGHGADLLARGGEHKEGRNGGGHLARRQPLLADHVGSMLAQGGEHHGGDPLLERLRLGLPAGQDEGVEAALVDDSGHLLPADGVGNADTTLLIVIQSTSRVPGIGDLQHPAHVRQDEARGAIQQRRADLLARGGEGEDDSGWGRGHSRHHRCRCGPAWLCGGDRQRR